MFADTIPAFLKPGLRTISLLHIDCDLYSSTKTVLDLVMPYVRCQPPSSWHGLCIVFDEWHGYEGCEQHEQRAWWEFVNSRPKSHPIDWTVLGHGAQQWGIKIV